MIFALQQQFNKLCTFVGSLFDKVGLRFINRWNSAHQIKIKSPHKDCVAAFVGRCDVRCPPAVNDLFVDPCDSGVDVRIRFFGLKRRCDGNEDANENRRTAT
ncbi:MAG: hypothetical protein ABGZ23_24015 [Fuerstiella sp.]